MVRAPHQSNRGRLCDHYLSRRTCDISLFRFPPSLPLPPFPIFSPPPAEQSYVCRAEFE
jgi:hypothetical protein